MEINLKVKEGTHETSWRIRCSETQTVQICVTETQWPLGSLTVILIVEVIEE